MTDVSAESLLSELTAEPDVQPVAPAVPDSSQQPQQPQMVPQQPQVTPQQVIQNVTGGQPQPVPGQPVPVQQLQALPAPEGFVPQADFDAARQAADGRLLALQQTRQQMGSMQQSIEELRQIMLTQAQMNAPDPQAEAIAKYGEQAMQHPAVKFMQDQFNALHQRIDEQQDEMDDAQENAQRQQLMAQGEQQIRNAVQASVGRLKVTKPDYDMAYQFARESRRRFYSNLDPATQEATINQEEMGLAAQALATGQDPATEVYNLALRLGYQPQQVQMQPGAIQVMPQPQVPQQPGQPQVQMSPQDIQRIQAGVNAGNASQLTSTPGAARTGVVSREQFFTPGFLPYAQRIAILSDPAKFQQLATQGATTIE